MLLFTDCVSGTGFKWKWKCCCKIGTGRNTDCIPDARISGKEWCPSWCFQSGTGYSLYKL